MCLAVPGKIISIKDEIATVDYELEKRKGAILDGNYKVGDYVIIQGNIVIQKIGKKEAKKALENYKSSMSA